ncbi:MAG TPA: hypothetical protein VN633_10085 [Bryobacteraceae bacterium]|nr:hypothetical protein [Bryobacteraceae bacterium]
MPNNNTNTWESSESDSLVTRRNFVAGSAAALSLVSSLDAKPGRKHYRNLFFNLSHISNASGPRSLFVAGRSYTMQPVHSGHPLVMQGRRTNRFLRSLPSSAITHVVENVQLPSDTVSTGYTPTPTSGGEWEMASFYMYIPPQGFQEAYKAITEKLEPGQPLPLSAKRMKYGIPSAANLQDLLDEQVLFDTANMAAAIVNLHPELLSVVPSSAALIQTNFISQRSVFGLTQYLDTAGPAQPQQSLGALNSSGWATLVPYTDNNGAPLVNQTGKYKGLIIYDPQWNPTTKALAATAMSSALRGAKNYVPTQPGNTINLGVDVTAGRNNIPDAQLLGTIWTRSDGQTSILQPADLVGSTSNVRFVLKNESLEHNGYSAALSSDDTTAISITFTNTFLRYLGVYAQFYDKNGVIPTKNLPSGIGNPDLNTTDSAYLGYISPEFTLYGIPIAASTLVSSFEFPTDIALEAYILAGGLGMGSHTFPDTEACGISLTALFNLITPASLLALGVATQLSLFQKTVVIPFLKLYVAEYINSIIAPGETPTLKSIANIFWKTFVKAELGPGVGVLVTKYFIPFLTEAEVIEAAEDAIPIAGLILQAIGVIATIAEIDETTIETLSSPWTYQYTLTGTHDLKVIILPARKQFPTTAALGQLTAIFDGGAPHVINFTVSSSPGPSLSQTFSNVPLGGEVTIHVALYDEAKALVGHGSAGPLTNDDKAAPSITITEVLLPITQGTKYEHKQKTTLDTLGNHQWTCAPAPATIQPVGFCDNAPGILCAFRDITVSSSSDNVGYGWESFSTASCIAGGAAQLDQMANIPATNGSGGNAQNGYALLPCALDPAAQMVYDPSTHASSNFYLDTKNNLLRQIQLNPPSFADPRGNQAWGKLNLSSTDLLLHPAGVIVSINSVSHKLESLRIPAGPDTDTDAEANLLATVFSGFGSRPGLMDTPTAATISADGVVLVLEAGNNRIHAMDIYGNPVRYFKKQATPYFLNFSQTGQQGTQYLDIAAEFTGFIYVLSSFTSDQTNYQYRLDIYASDQTGSDPISTTTGFNAARLAVDYWRNVYSLNYEVLKLPNGNLPPSGITEPSISLWVPTTPPPCDVGGENPPPGHGRPPHKCPKPHRPPHRLLRRRDFWRP